MLELLSKERRIEAYRLEEDMSLTFKGQLKQRAYFVDHISRCGEQLFIDLFVDIGNHKLFYSPDGGVHWKYMGKNWRGKPFCMLADSTYVRIFTFDLPYKLQSYTHKRILSD